MNPRQIIEKKRDGGILTEEEIGYFIRAYTSSAIEDYHAAALLMAIFLNGMTTAEVLAMTRVMLLMGEILNLSSIPDKKVDKHSTGGVGDKTSLVLAPIAASCGITVPMITGRALGHTGGTLDKLQSIPGFNPQPSPHELLPLLRQNKAVLMGPTEMLGRADRRLYALRDATGTVESIPLITASILSKKLAEGIDGLVLDVKTGSGAFMPTKQLSVELARTLMGVCRKMKTDVVVLITDMDQPLGRTVGNAIEVKECLDFLNGNASEDLKTVTFALAAEMIRLAGKAQTHREGSRMASDAVSSGRARQSFIDIITGQGGDIRAILNHDLLPKAQNITPVAARRSGHVVRADAKLLGEASSSLGAGRVRTDDVVDPAVGLYLHKKVGDSVERGETLCDVHWNDETCLKRAIPFIEEAYEIGPRSPRRRPLIHAVLKE